MRKKNILISSIGVMLVIALMLISSNLVHKTSEAEEDISTMLVMSGNPQVIVANEDQVTMTIKPTITSFDLPIPDGLTYQLITTGTLTDDNFSYDDATKVLHFERTDTSKSDIAQQVTITYVASKVGNYSFAPAIVMNGDVKLADNLFSFSVSVLTSEDDATGDDVATETTTDAATTDNYIATPAVSIQSDDIVAADYTDMTTPPTSGPSVTEGFTAVGTIPAQSADNAQNVEQITSSDKGGVSGAIWYKSKLDMTKPFASKAFVYIGGNSQNSVADGVTFTLQDESATALGDAGEGMGAYGSFTGSYGSNYIKNAVSFEIDPYYNPNTSDHDFSSMRHVAYVFPSADNVHRGRHSDELAITHYNVTSEEGMISNSWKQLDISWTPGETNGTLLVTYDGKAIGTGQSVPMDTFPSGSAWWGFTASTGNTSMTSAVAYSSVPQQPEVKAEVMSVPDGQYAESASGQYGDIFRYRVTGTNTSENGLGNAWSDVVLNNSLPEGLTFCDENGVPTDHPTAIINDTLGYDGTVNIGSNESNFYYVTFTQNKEQSLSTTFSATGENGVEDTDVTVTSNVVTINQTKKLVNAKPSITQTVVNNTYTDPRNTSVPPAKLYQVLSNDSVTFTGTVSNAVSVSPLTNGIYTLAYPTGMRVDSVLVDGTAVTTDRYSTSTVSANMSKLVLTGLNFAAGEAQHIVVVNGTIGTGNSNYAFQATYSGVDETTQSYFVQSDNYFFNFGNDTLEVDMSGATDLEYGPLNSTAETNADYQRTSVNPGILVVDNRRTKNVVQLTVSQDELFHKPGSEIDVLSANLRYYFNSTTSTDLDIGTPKPIMASATGQVFPSILWDADTGPLFHLPQSPSKAGVYTASITWTFNYAP